MDLWEWGGEGSGERLAASLREKELHCCHCDHSEVFRVKCDSSRFKGDLRFLS